MDQFIYKIKNNPVFYSLFFLIITGLATLCGYLFLNYSTINIEMKKQMDVYKDSYIYMAHPDLSIKKEIKKETIVASYKYDYIEFDGEILQVIKTNKNGVIQGIPMYDSSFQLLSLPEENYLLGIYYSTTDRTGCTPIKDIEYPKDLFIKHTYPKEVIFIIEEDILLDADYYIINSIELYNKLSNQNSINVPLPSSFVGDGTYIKNSLNQNSFYIIFSILSFLPLLFTTFIFHILSKYHIERMQQEIKIRMIYFSSQAQIRKQIFLEQFILISLSVLCSGILSCILLLGNISFGHLLLCMCVTLGVYALLSYHNISKAIKVYFKQTHNLVIKEVIV